MYESNWLPARNSSARTEAERKLTAGQSQNTPRSKIATSYDGSEERGF